MRHVLLAMLVFASSGACGGYPPYAESLRLRVGQMAALPLRIPHTGTLQAAQVSVTIAPSGLLLPLTANAVADCTAAMGPGRAALTVAVACPGARFTEDTVAWLKVLPQHPGTVWVRLVRCEIDERAVPCGDDLVVQVRP